MSETVQREPAEVKRPMLNVGLWCIQSLLAVFFIYAGYIKLAIAPDELSQMLPWASEHPALVSITGYADLLGGLGILLPTLLRIFPRLSLLAAIGLAVLQLLAMAFHLSRGEVMVVPVNVVLIALSLFVLWGRGRALPSTR